MVKGKLEMSTTMVFGLHREDLLDELLLLRGRCDSRSRPSRPSLGTVQGRVPPPSTVSCQSCAMSGPQVGSLPTMTMATSELCGRVEGCVGRVRRRRN